MHATYPGDYRFQSYCMVVRGDGGGLEPVFLFAAVGRCPNSGLRPRLPLVERALYRMLRSAWWQQIQSEAVTVALHAKFAMNWQSLKPWLSIGTYAALLLEALAPFILWTPRLGALGAYRLISMHLSLELTTNLGWWSHTMIASRLCFPPPEHLKALLRKLPLRLRGRDESPAQNMRALGPRPSRMRP